MYKIYADDTLIYDSTIEDFKIGKGVVTLETNKSGSFVFSLYPDHFYYDKFVKLKTIIKVLRDEKIVFRGRILNDITDYWNNKVITCEGELGFLHDSIIRPFTFSGTPEDLFKKFIYDHNADVEVFKRFKIGKVTVKDSNDKIARSNSAYETTMSNLNSRLIDDSLGGYFYITHGVDGTDDVPTINYLADFENKSGQVIEFGSNLKNYTKTITANDIATVIIPLGAEIDDNVDNTPNPKLTISAINGGRDYVCDDTAVALYGRITKVVEWQDVTVAENLKTKALKKLENIVKQNVTIELSAIDLHLLDRSINSFNVCEYVRVISKPHNFDSVLLCNKLSLDLLKPDNDSLVLGYTYSTFTETTSEVSKVVSSVSTIKTAVNRVNDSVIKAQADADKALTDYGSVSNDLTTLNGDVQGLANAIVETARNVSTNAGNISKNASEIALLTKRTDQCETEMGTLKTNISAININAGNIRKDLDNTVNSLADTDKKVSVNTTDITRNKTNISNLRTGQNDLQKSIDTINTTAGSLRMDVDKNTSTITDILVRLEKLETSGGGTSGGGTSGGGTSGGGTSGGGTSGGGTSGGGTSGGTVDPGV